MRHVSCWLRCALPRKLPASPRPLVASQLLKASTDKPFLPLLISRRSLVLFPFLRLVDPVDPETLLRMLEDPKDREMLARVIDGSGNSLGTMSLADAKKIAFEKELRLVHLGDEGAPPVPLYRLQASVQEPKGKSRKREAKRKILRLHASISGHDLAVKINQLHDMLSKGYVVRVEVSQSKGSVFDVQSLVSRVKSELDGKANFGPAQGTDRHMVIVLTPHQST